MDISITQAALMHLGARLEGLGPEFKGYLPCLHWVLGLEVLTNGNKTTQGPHYMFGLVQVGFEMRGAVKIPAGVYGHVYLCLSPEDASGEKTVLDRDENGFFMR